MIKSVALQKLLTIPLSKRWHALKYVFAGALLPLGFAPFHLPGFSLMGLALLYVSLEKKTVKQSFYIGALFGIGFLGFGVSWVYISIYEYGHLNSILSASITSIFVLYLSIFPALAAAAYAYLRKKTWLGAGILFSACWCISEYLRATLFSGFPWLLVGFGQMDSPFKYLFPIIGVYGVSFVSCLAATCLVKSIKLPVNQRLFPTALFVVLLMSPLVLKSIEWGKKNPIALPVAVIQANLSMKDKWDEQLFWHLLAYYRDKIDPLVGAKKLIVLPESAIPLPQQYISDFLTNLHQQAKKNNTALLLGIPESTQESETSYYNAAMALGVGQGHYLKQHLVPFGEYIPSFLATLIKWLKIPIADLLPGESGQMLIHIQHHPIATLICYELAYPELLRQQLPKAQWIVSISDDGWFGHSLALYQHLQMAQVLSLQTHRFQVVANNDGLSSIIDEKGEIAESLPAFTSGILEGDIHAITGSSPWVYWGDYPILLLCIFIVLARRKSGPKPA